MIVSHPFGYIQQIQQLYPCKASLKGSSGTFYSVRLQQGGGMFPQQKGHFSQTVKPSDLGLRGFHNCKQHISVLLATQSEVSCCITPEGLWQGFIYTHSHAGCHDV